MIRLLMLLTRAYKPLSSKCMNLMRKVRASSILETVVAMTLLLTILTLSFMALDRINRTVNAQMLYKAHLATTAVLAKNDLLIEELDEYEVDAYLVKKAITPLSKTLFQIELSVINGSGHEVYTRKILKSDDIRL